MTDLLGQTIGNCRIEALLGSGGMGRVFRARHIHLDRPQALKVMHDQIAQEASFQARFRREARALALLDHMYIVKLYECSEDRGRFFMGMELLADGSLRGLLERRAREGRGWSAEQHRQWRLVGLDLGRQAAEALAFAHKQGVVHRDVKPDNLLLDRQRRPDGSSAFQLKVGDFGLAQIADSGGMLTASGLSVGTPAYMSPEQCQALEVDGRTDVYSLGVVLYELLTGFLPFAAKTASEVVRKHLYEAPRSPRELDPGLPLEVEALLLRCLAKEPAERFAEAGGLAAALRALIADFDHKPTPPPAPPQHFRVIVLDAAGRSLRSIALPDAGLSVGRLGGNDLVLDDPAVSRNHLRIGRGRTRARATDLGSKGGTLLGGAPLAPFVEQPWAVGKPLQVGPFTLQLEAAAPARLAVRLPAAEGPLVLTPGELATQMVVVANVGGEADGFNLAVEGVPISWVQLPPLPPALGPGASVTLALAIDVPAGPAGPAGDYSVVVQARPAASPAAIGEAVARWRVSPAPAAQLAIAPGELTAAETGQYSVTVTNAGNVAGRFRLSAQEPSGELRFAFADESVALAPGETATIILTIQARKRILGRRRTYPFTVYAATPEVACEAGAAFVQDGPLLF